MYAYALFCICQMWLSVVCVVVCEMLLAATCLLEMTVTFLRIKSNPHKSTLKVEEITACWGRIRAAVETTNLSHGSQGSTEQPGGKIRAQRTRLILARCFGNIVARPLHVPSASPPCLNQFASDL